MVFWIIQIFSNVIAERDLCVVKNTLQFDEMRFSIEITAEIFLSFYAPIYLSPTCEFSIQNSEKCEKSFISVCTFFVHVPRCWLFLQ